MNYRELYYPESRFGDFTDIDGVITFYCRVNSLIRPSDVILDIGCGRGAYLNDPVSFRRKLRTFKGKCAKVIGIDIDNAGQDNPFLDEFRLIEGERWPIADESVDVAVCDAVLEHIEHPDNFFSELKRVIKPGGYACIKTINKKGYVSVLSRLIPERYHRGILKKVQPARKEKDIFKAYYKINTVTSIRQYFQKYGFENCVYSYEAEPSYLAFSKIIYWFGVQYQKYAPRRFKNAIFAFGRKATPAG